MSGQEDGAERSHEATPQKLLEARRRGELVRSQDVTVAAAYLGALGCLALGAGAVGQGMLDLGGTLLAGADALSAPLSQGGAGAGGAVLGRSLWIVALIVAPAAALVALAIAAQQSLVFAPEKLAPKLSRISPLANARNKFGPNGLFEFAKSAAKLTLYGVLLGWMLLRRSDEIVAAAALPAHAAIALMPALLFDFLVAVVLCAAALAVVDYAWQRHSHLAKNRMTRQEVLDETKRSEGDPHMKAKRRQRGQDLATNRMLVDVADASVVVVNPTHYAVALRWSPMDPTPPLVVAKGVDEIAARIREAAVEHGVPIHSDPPTARALHAGVEVGAPIDREHFAAVAAAIRFAQAMRDAARGRP
jgi:flagellar biosynthetic protein FlhB